MADREKVIKGLECCNNPNDHENCPYNGAPHYNICTHQLLTDAIELLKKQEPRVLTTDELFYMEHKGVYLERRNSQVYGTEPSIVLRTAVCEPSLGGKKYVLMRENRISEPHLAWNYNKAINNGWRCWSAKPTLEQREAVKWDE